MSLDQILHCGMRRVRLKASIANYLNDDLKCSQTFSLTVFAYLMALQKQFLSDLFFSSCAFWSTAATLLPNLELSFLPSR